MLLCSIFLQLFLIFLGLLLGREETWISSLLFRCRGEAFWSELATLNFYSLEEILCDLGLETWEEAATPPSSVLACPPLSPLFPCAQRRCCCSSGVSSSTHCAFHYRIFTLQNSSRGSFYLLSQISRMSEQRSCQWKWGRSTGGLLWCSPPLWGTPSTPSCPLNIPLSWGH